jgi:purine-binding chemotaxis protein CheW
MTRRGVDVPAGRGVDDVPIVATPVTGYVTFRLGERVYATDLAAVREIVRLGNLAVLPAMRHPLAGVLDLRGAPLPVADIRPAGASDGSGDVLVLEAVDGAEPVGVAVDAVCAVVDAGELVPAAGPGRGALLPPYVVEVRRADHCQVFVVDLWRMVGLAVA